jgi:hypothetical protein
VSTHSSGISLWHCWPTVLVQLWSGDCSSLLAPTNIIVSHSRNVGYREATWPNLDRQDQARHPEPSHQKRRKRGFNQHVSAGMNLVASCRGLAILLVFPPPTLYASVIILPTNALLTWWPVHSAAGVSPRSNNNQEHIPGATHFSSHRRRRKRVIRQRSFPFQVVVGPLSHSQGDRNHAGKLRQT